MAALTADPEWKRALLDAVGDSTSGRTWQLVQDVAVFRDRWALPDSSAPLGLAPADSEWEQVTERARLTQAIEDARSRSVAPEHGTSSEELSPPQQVFLTSAGWQL